MHLCALSHRFKGQLVETFSRTTTSPVVLKVGSMEGPMQVVMSKQYSCKQ